MRTWRPSAAPALVVLVLAAASVQGDDSAADVTREELEDLYDDLDAFWLLFSESFDPRMEPCID